MKKTVGLNELKMASHDNFLTAANDALRLIYSYPDKAIPLEISSGPYPLMDGWKREVTWTLTAGMRWHCVYREEFGADWLKKEIFSQLPPFWDQGQYTGEGLGPRGKMRRARDDR